MKLLAVLLLAIVVYSCAKSVDDFKNVTAESIIKLIPSVTKAEADGYSVVSLSATIPNKADNDKRTIVFQTTAGTFMDTGTNTTSLAVNSDGTATAILQAPTSPETALASAIVAGTYKQTVTIQFTQVSPANSLSLSPPSNATLLADGASIVQIQAAVPVSASGTSRSITMTTTGGVFVSNGMTSIIVKPETNNSLSVPLRSPNSGGYVYVTGETSMFRQTIPLFFIDAPVESISVDPGTFSIPAGLNQQTTVTAQLLRKTGVPSPNVDVAFQAFDSTGTRKLNQGQFRSITRSNNTGAATAIYTAGNTLYRGKTVIQASVYNGTISGSAIVTVINP